MPLNDIVRVQAFKPGFGHGRFRLWGTGAPDVWFACDWRRPARDCLFRVRLRSQRIEPAFSAERPEQLKSILAARGLLAT
ncbi:hypothetical protein [Salinisphaera hydrothermalis]|uniref:Uncharacterized protein n=1 Tax=Salinisphaera hydrothermalis (strain C41B8) TaxID=1304275 RepID=A0A084IRG5_SALHC|nr:hypothetical protein [Salinisphaera hydrothermalis]KEZ79299.1 hypothetical protein C41B8_01080 [Salinisphaera hydrothermalis C41B8]